jgi:hypothetical protein
VQTLKTCRGPFILVTLAIQHTPILTSWIDPWVVSELSALNAVQKTCYLNGADYFAHPWLTTLGGMHFSEHHTACLLKLSFSTKEFYKTNYACTLSDTTV